MTTPNATALIFLPLAVLLAACAPLPLDNTAPTEPLLWISGSEYVGEQLDIFTMSRDADDDKFAFRLTIASDAESFDTGWTTFHASGDTLGFTAVLSAGEWTLSVVARDELGATSATASATVTVLYPAPATWAYVTTQIDEPVQELFFLDAMTGWMAGPTKVFRTTDGGETWIGAPHGAPTVREIFFVDALSGWFISATRLYATTDGGGSWDYVPTGTSGEIYGIWFLDELRGWAVTSDPHFSETRDGGLTWSEIETGYPGYYLADIFFLDDQFGYMVGDSGLRLRTTDGGETWDASQTPTDQDLDHVYFLDHATGWTYGDYRGRCHRTNDGGDTWELVDSPEVRYMHPDGRGWGLGSQQIYYTFDGGTRWFQITYMSGGDVISRLAMVSVTSGWGIATDGRVIRAFPVDREAKDLDVGIRPRQVVGRETESAGESKKPPVITAPDGRAT